MRTIAERQQFDKIKYRRIPIRESSNPASLVSNFSCFNSSEKSAFHLDIAHIVPHNINTMLFELLMIGVLKNNQTCKVYHRNPNDIYFIEIPNSKGEKTAAALRFCSLLPTVHISVTPEEIELTRPIFKDNLNTQIGLPEYTELIFVTKFLRAWKQGKFLPGHSNFDAEYNPYLDSDISPIECFDILSEYCADDGKQ
jgi:hypothetical protein